MTKVTGLKWKRQQDIRGWGAAIALGDDLLTEATVMRRQDRTAEFDIFGPDGLTIVASGEARTVAAAKKAAEYAMRRVNMRVA